ncbi:MAG: alkaline phosphatase family protein, partial [Arenimonas sp.]
MAPVAARSNPLVLLALACGLATASACGTTTSSHVATQRTAPDAIPLRLILALDGIPHEVVAQMQSRGELTQFRPAARMISTFPSLSDVAFAQIEGGAPPPGYQVTRYDPETNRTVGMDVGSLSERAHPKIAADSASGSVAHRLLGYVVPEALARRDLRRVAKQLLASRKPTFVAYIGTSDAVLHLKGRAGAEAYLRVVDTVLADLRAQVRARTGRDLLIDLVSDHGSTMT